MKQKDIALLAVIVVISAVVSIVLSNILLASPKNRQQEVEVVQPITANFEPPDTTYFNKDAFDPTRTITIGANNNADPFSGQ